MHAPAPVVLAVAVVLGAATPSCRARATPRTVAARPGSGQNTARDSGLTVVAHEPAVADASSPPAAFPWFGRMFSNDNITPDTPLPAGYTTVDSGAGDAIRAWLRVHPRWYWRGAQGCIGVGYRPSAHSRRGEILTDGYVQGDRTVRARFEVDVDAMEFAAREHEYTDGRSFLPSSEQRPVFTIGARRIVTFVTPPVIAFDGPTTESRDAHGSWRPYVDVRCTEPFAVVRVEPDRVTLVPGNGNLRGYRPEGAVHWDVHRERCESVEAQREPAFAPCAG